MRNFIILIITFVMTINVVAQKRNGLGVHVGFNTAGMYSLTDGYDDSYDALSSIQAGIRYNLKLGPIGICPELNYIDLKYGQSDFGIEYTQNLSYISTPLLFKFYIGGINIHFGPQLSYLIGGTEEISSGGNTISESITDDMYYNNINGTDYWLFEDVDIAAVVGFGIDTKMGVYVSARSVISMTPIGNVDIYDALSVLYDGDNLTRLVSAQLSIGYTF